MQFTSTIRDKVTPGRITRLMALYESHQKNWKQARGIDWIVDLVLERVALLEVYK